VDLALYTHTPDIGKNPKINNMHMAWNQSKYDLILISDSNVKVSENYLEELMSVRQNGAGLVTQVIYGADAHTLAGHFDVIHSNTFYLKSSVILNLIKIPVVLGKAMLLSKRILNSKGGLHTVRNYLAEDFMIGKIMDQSGYKIELSKQLLRQSTVMTDFSSYWNRHVRWARLRKAHVWYAYLLEPLLFETLWPALLFFVSAQPLTQGFALFCLGLQVLANVMTHKFIIKESSSLQSMKWFWAKDMLIVCIWISGLLSNKVDWRGKKLQLRFGGKLLSPNLRSSRGRKLLQALQQN
jgi:ceramide glucosyltransferase